MALTRPKAAQINFDLTNISDPVIRLNSDKTDANDTDVGFIFERGSTGDNAIIAWDESADAFVMGTTTATGTSTGDLTIANGELRLDTLRIDQSGTGLRMTNVGAFDNDGSDNFRIFATNDLKIAANGDSGTAITIDATNQDVTITNDLRVTAGQFYYGGTAVTSTAAELNYLDGVTGITLGTANELLIVGSDGSSIESDGTLTIDPGNNYVGINQASPEVTLHMTGEGAQTAQIRMEQYNDSADAPDVRTRRYRGTIASPSAVQSGDYLFRSNHEYWNGTSLLVGGAFAFDNTNNANRTQFSVAVDIDGTGADPQGNNGQFKIDGNDGGAITFNNAYKFPTSDGSANQILQTNGSGVLSFTGSPTFTGLTVDTNTLYVDSSNNRVGIGTTSPAYQVEIENTGANALLVLDRTDGAACFIEGQATRSAFGSVGATPLALAYNSFAVVTIGENGAITVNPDGDGYTFPTTDGSANQILQTDGSGTLSFVDNTGSGLGNVVEDTTPQLGGDLDVNGQTITSASNGHIEITPNGTGNVGIGDSAPLDKVHIYEAVNSATATQLLLQNEGAGNHAAGIAFQVSSSGETTGFAPKAGIVFERQLANGRGSLKFFNDIVNDANGFSATDEVMRIDSAGNVGIGTSSPSKKLEVSGTDARIYLTGANTDIDMTGTADGQLSLDGNGYAFGIALNASGANLYTNSASRDLIFGTNETERMRIDGVGNVGIGTSNPSTKLEVVGTVTATLFDGTATSARYADLAENYVADAQYEPGTVLIFGGQHEVTASRQPDSNKIAGVVSTAPGVLMNKDCEGEYVVALAFTGRVPTKVKGTISKGDMMVSSNIEGVAVASNNPQIGTVIGKALENYDSEEVGVIEVVVGRL